MNSGSIRHGLRIKLNAHAQLRGAVFDMDGVIVDSHPAHRYAWKQFLESIGRPATDGEIDFILDGRKREEILRHFLGELTAEEIREYGNRKDQMLRSLGGHLRAINGAIEFLTSLRQAGLVLGLATSAARARTDATLLELGIGNFFDAIVTGDDVQVGKPDPSIYSFTAERLHHHPSHLLAFEDSVSGLQAASSAGLRCIGVGSGTRVEKLRAAGAKLVIRDFTSMNLSNFFPDPPPLSILGPPSRTSS